MNVRSLQPRRHAPPPGWTAPAFEAVTDALAAALVAAVRRQIAAESQADPWPPRRSRRAARPRRLPRVGERAP